MEALVFVYGTLRRGEGNHRRLATARYLGATRAAGFRLYDLGGCPAAVACPGSSVAGEVYAVDGPTLASVDRLEGHPVAWRRVRRELSTGTVGWIYTMTPGQVGGAEIIPGGDWISRSRAPRFLANP